MRNPTSSDTRSPVAYKVSSIARSRMPSGLAVSGTASNSSTSASDETRGNRVG